MKARPITRRIARGLILLCVILISSSIFLLIFLGFTLKAGIRIEHISTGNLESSGIHLVWRDRLALYIDNIRIVPSQTKQITGKTPTHLEPYLQKALTLAPIFSQIEILSLRSPMYPRPVKVSLVPQGNGWICNLSSADIKTAIHISSTKDMIQLEITSASHALHNLSLSGAVHVTQKNNTASGKLTVTLKEMPPLFVRLEADKKGITFTAEMDDTFTSTQPFINLFSHDHETEKWAVEKIIQANYQLLDLSGFIPWESPMEIRKTLHAQIQARDCIYSFADELPPVRAPNVDISYLKGVLRIKPHEAIYADQSIGDGFVELNFNSQETTPLTVQLDTDVVINGDIQNLLNHYEIKLPFSQKSGKTQMVLELLFLLDTGEVNTTGRFESTNSEILWRGNSFLIDHGLVNLSGSNLEIKQMNLEIADLFTLSLDGHLNVTNKTGEFSLKLEQLPAPPKDFPIHNKPDNPLEIDYTFGPSEHVFSIEPSSWSFANHNINVGKIDGSFEPEKFLLKINPAVLSSSTTFRATLSGEYSMAAKKSTADIILHTFNNGFAQLASENLPLKLNYQDDWRIEIERDSLWRFKSTPVKLSSASLFIKGDQIAFSTNGIKTPKISGLNLTSSYHRKKREGNFQIGDLLVQGTSFDRQAGTFSGTFNDFSAKLNDLSLYIQKRAKGGLVFKFTQLDEVSRRLPWLKECSVRGGQLTITSEGTDGPFFFTGEIPCATPLLSRDGEDINLYQFSGNIFPPTVQVSILDKINIKLDSQLDIFTRDIDFNLPAIRTILQSHRLENSDGPSAQFPPLHLIAHNSKIILGENHHAAADQFDLRMKNGKLNLNLLHGPGKIQLATENEQFTLVGEKLDEHFMKGLDSNAMLRGGELSFVAKGAADNFTAIITLKDVVIEKLTTLNKILSILNTLPSLASLSLPDFSTSGLPVKMMVAGLERKDNIVNIKTLDLKSPQMDMSGTGWIDVQQKLIDMDLNIITMAKSRLSKIPLLGYIIVGNKKRPSITAEISGSINEPKVTHSTFRRIPTIPFSILYRTLTLPYAIVEPLYKTSEELEETK